MIGYLEDITFSVSDAEILTIKDFSHSSSVKLHNHEVIGKKPLTEFIGCELDKITFSIELNIDYGVSIEDTLETLRVYEQSGTPLNLVLGRNTFGTDKWVIENTSRAYNKIFQGGVCHSVNVDLSLSEYLTDKTLQPNQVKKTFKNKTAVNVQKTKMITAYQSCGVNSSMNALLNSINA